MFCVSIRCTFWSAGCQLAGWASVPQHLSSCTIARLTWHHMIWYVGSTATSINPLLHPPYILSRKKNPKQRSWTSRGTISPSFLGISFLALGNSDTWTSHIISWEPQRLGHDEDYSDYSSVMAWMFLWLLVVCVWAFMAFKSWPFLLVNQSRSAWPDC